MGVKEKTFTVTVRGTELSVLEKMIEYYKAVSSPTSCVSACIGTGLSTYVRLLNLKLTSAEAENAKTEFNLGT